MILKKIVSLFFHFFFFDSTLNTKNDWISLIQIKKADKNKDKEFNGEVWRIIDLIKFPQNDNEEKNKLYNILLENGFDHFDTLKELDLETALILKINFGTFTMLQNAIKTHGLIQNQNSPNIKSILPLKSKSQIKKKESSNNGLINFFFFLLFFKIIFRFYQWSCRHHCIKIFFFCFNFLFYFI